MSDIFERMKSLVKRASDAKAEQIKAAGISEKLDNAEDGTSSADTGSRAAQQKTDQNAMYPANMVDTGAKDNAAGGSVEASTDGASAGATDGSSGSKTTEFAVAKDADNGEEKAENKIAAEARTLAAELRKAASEILTPFDRFLIAAVKSSSDPQVKTAAEGMAEDDLADAAADSLAQQLEAGQISDEDAAQILEEAVQAGAITPEEIQAAAAEMQSAGGAPEGAPAGDMGGDPMLEQKVAAAEVGPDHPDYIRKLAHFYAADIEQGYKFAMDLAQELSAEGESCPDEEKKEEETEGEEKAEGEAAPAAPAPEGAPAEPVLDGGLPTPANPEEQAALQAVQQELGLDDAALQQLMAAPVPEAAKVAMAKVASALTAAGTSFEDRVRTLLIQKVAALRK